MTLEKIAQKLNLHLKTDADTNIDIKLGYASDLLSDVLAKAQAGTIWVTNHKHQNVIGVAVMLGLGAVVMAGGIEPDELALEKAEQEKLPLFTTEMSLFEVVGKLFELGIRSS